MFRNLPPVTKYLILINCFFLLIDYVFSAHGAYLNGILGLHYFAADGFFFWEPVTYMFMHAGIWHLFCNMFAVMMFGPALEHEWGSTRFLIYYFICGLGAAAVQELVWHIQLLPYIADADPAYIRTFTNRFVTIGASGAVFGILLAFGWLFPDVRLFLFFLPIPIRARTFVILYAVFELLAGIGNVAGDNVAHFAHLGGMFFGALLIWYWRRWGYGLPFKGLFRGKNRSDDETDKDYSDYHYQKRI